MTTALAAAQEAHGLHTEVLLYHSGLDDTVREEVCVKFADGRAAVVIATDGFALGVHAADIELVAVTGACYSEHQLVQMVRLLQYRLAGSR
jgi:ATP-dependent helicase YprA (DUF1998 family)